MRTERKSDTGYWKHFSSPKLPTALPSESHRKHPTWTSMPESAVSHPPLTDWEHPRAMDEHWTAVTAYLSDLDFPNEG